MEKITQDGRQLNIATPLGKDFLLLNKLSANEGLSQLFSFELELLHEEDEEGYETTLIEPGDVLGKTFSVTVSQRDGGARYFTGIVNRFSQGNRNDRFSYYYATIVPHVWILTQNIQSRIFQHQSVPDILRKVFADFEVSYEIQGDFKPRNFCVQYRESDFDFASRLMEEEGIYYYFEHDGNMDKLVLGNTPQSHRDCPNKSQLPYVVETGSEEIWASAIRSWKTEYTLQSGKVTTWDYNFQLPTNKLDGEQPSQFSHGDNQKMEIYDFPGGYARKYDGIDKSGGEQAASLNSVYQDKQNTVKIQMQALDAQVKISKGYSDCCTLTAGYRFNLVNHPSKSLNKQYVITTVQHQAEQTPDYASGDESAIPYESTFNCIPHGAGVPVFRPLMNTPKPIVNGTQTAVVVGPAGEEIFTDKYGRVKVNFHWDRELKFDPDSSCWVRVAREIAGKKWGSMHIPRIGQEVIVDFEEGDPDKPIIVGAVYNPETMPHYELPKFKTLTYFKTRTSPDDGKGFNELRFEDKGGKEQVFIRSQKRMDVRVLQSLYETCGGNRQEVIGMRQDNKPGGNLAISVGGNYDLHVKGDWYIGIDGKLNEGVKGDVVEGYDANQQTVVTGNRELNAKEITLEAMSKITLKVGGSFITVDQSGVTISGMMVKINSGGAGMGTGPATIDDPLDAETADTGEPGYLDKPRTGGGRTRNRRTLKGQHAPPFPTKTLANGDIQCGNGLIIHPSRLDPDFQNKVLRDLTIMSNHPTGMNTLNSMNNSGHTVDINHTIVNGGNATNFANNKDATAKGKPALGGGTGTGKGTNSSIDYNPDFEPPTNANPSINRPADVGLHHELAHADDGAHGRDDDTTDPAHPGQAIAESNVIDRDNQYRDNRGIPRRKDHSTL